ncbi:hypothetical protein BV25DRAFT_1238553 [Artomyces pyxidatus]|uniref:Uncharacterized protein n=1 Tax=Artomyces pyxidatus TaxID=48021 RepID=A0ACB8SPM9_9AGAM|nr:hypothetical protein BV25DRAFT_1238553 [Artomyces pyxidatus]
MSLTSSVVSMAAPTSQTATSPPILALLPVVSYSFSAVAATTSFISNTFLSLVSLLLTPFAFIIPAFLYLFSPVILSFYLLLDAFVVVPYRVTVYIAQAIYPLYAFIGVAVICGSMIGFGARKIVSVIGWSLLARPKKAPPRKRDTSRGPTQRKPVVKGKRRATVKIEAD